MDINQAKSSTNSLADLLKTFRSYVQELTVHDEQLALYDNACLEIIAVADAEISYMENAGRIYRDVLVARGVKKQQQISEYLNGGGQNV